MSLRDQFTEQLKTAMKGGDSVTTGTIRMILAKVKDADINARPKGIDKIPDEEIQGALRSMIKTRKESIALYQQGHRQDLADKEQTEIVVIERFLPAALDETAVKQAIAEAIAATGAASGKDIGKVIGALKAKHGAAIDMSMVSPLVKAALS